MGFSSFVHNLGHKIQDAGHRLGNKVRHGLHEGAKFVAKHADVVADAASKVGKVAGVVGKVASAAIPFTAEIPVVGEVVAGVAAGAKGAQMATNAIQKGARIAGKVSQAALKMGL